MPVARSSIVDTPSFLARKSHLQQIGALFLRYRTRETERKDCQYDDVMDTGFSEDPLELFRTWMEDAEQNELNDANAAALATANENGHPSVRMVLIKQYDSAGFRFFTNCHSQKGRELQVNPHAALCFHWKSLRRQVRAEGVVSYLSDQETNDYFHSRSRRSQIAAAVSRQSENLQDRILLEDAVEMFTQEHEGLEIARPAGWKGFILNPTQIEFWSDGEARLHHRILFKRTMDTWRHCLLYP